MRTLLSTIARMNSALLAAYLLASLCCIGSLASGDRQSAATFAILSLLALGVETKARNPATIAMRLARRRPRWVVRPVDPSRN